LAASFLAADLVDRWLHYQAPVAVGSGVQWPERPFGVPPRFELTSCHHFGRDLGIVYDRHPFARVLEDLTRPIVAD
jgi:riboflavin biosynthesis pyrimidine reductase